MKNSITLFLIIITALPALGQRFRPYHRFGVQIISENPQSMRWESSDQDLYPIDPWRMDIRYDYSFHSKLRFGTGLGYSKRGDKTGQVIYPQTEIDLTSPVLLNPIYFQYMPASWFVLELEWKNVFWLSTLENPAPDEIDIWVQNKYTYEFVVNFVFPVYKGLEFKYGLNLLTSKFLQAGPYQYQSSAGIDFGIAYYFSTGNQ